MIEVVDNYLTDCDKSDQFKFRLDSGVTDEISNKFCDGSISFLSDMDLIYTFEDSSFDHPSII